MDELSSASSVRLTTFRRDGTPVPTPVWIVREGEQLLVVTTSSTGKAKRLRHTARVLVATCDRRGRVEPGTPEAQGSATVVTDPAAVEQLTTLLVRKYGLPARLMGIGARLRKTETIRLEITLA